MFSCDDRITNVGIGSALCARPTLKSFSFSPLNMKHEISIPTSHFIDSLVSLKGLTCLDLQFMNL